MRLPPVIIDTNILVSGMITKNKASPPGLIVDGMLQASFPFLLSVELLHEYRQVLLRPAIQRLHRLAAAELDMILEEITANVIFRESLTASAQAPDVNDQHLWNLLFAEKHVVLITGDQLLLKKPPAFAQVISAQSFLSLSKLGVKR